MQILVSQLRERDAQIRHLRGDVITSLESIQRRTTSIERMMTRGNKRKLESQGLETVSLGNKQNTPEKIETLIKSMDAVINEEEVTITHCDNSLSTERQARTTIPL